MILGNDNRFSFASIEYNDRTPENIKVIDGINTEPYGENIDK